MKLKSWKDTSDFYSKLEFKGPQIHLKNLALQANLFKPDWITEEKLKGIYRRESLPKKAIEKLNNEIEKAIKKKYKMKEIFNPKKEEINKNI